MPPKAPFHLLDIMLMYQSLNLYILIKLIDRFGRSDETSLAYRNDMMRELSEASEKISYLSGRINGRNNH